MKGTEGAELIMGMTVEATSGVHEGASGKVTGVAGGAKIEGTLGSSKVKVQLREMVLVAWSKPRRMKGVHSWIEAGGRTKLRVLAWPGRSP